MSFGVIRLTAAILAIAAQIHIFLSIRSALLSANRSDRFKRRAVLACGLLILALSASYWLLAAYPIEPGGLPRQARIALFYLPVLWVFGSIFSSAILLVIQAALYLGRTVKSDSGSKELAAADPERRLFIQAGMGGLAAAPLFVSGYGAFHVSRSIEVREVSIPIGRMLRAVQLTDIHSGPFMTRSDMRRCAGMVNSLKPDVFFLTGDLIANSIKFLPACLEEMARVEARYGTFACLGNHELWYADAGYLEEIYEKHGIRLLNNSHAVLETRQGPLAVAGIDDLETGDSDIEAALRGIKPGVPTILLSHRPEIFRRAAESNVRLTLSGHYHGGQIVLRFPGVVVSAAHLKTKYPEGLFRIRGSYLYVSRGIGTTLTPVRLNAEPEITLLDLY